MAETRPNAVFMFQRSPMAPIRGGEMASPRAWMRKMLRANAVERVAAGVTLSAAIARSNALRHKTTQGRLVAHDEIADIDRAVDHAVLDACDKGELATFHAAVEIEKGQKGAAVIGCNGNLRRIAIIGAGNRAGNGFTPETSGQLKLPDLSIAPTQTHFDTRCGFAVVASDRCSLELEIEILGR